MLPNDPAPEGTEPMPSPDARPGAGSTPMDRTNSLDGQAILLIAPDFFGYDRDIEAELVARGARVTRLLDRPFRSAFMKAMTRFARQWTMPFAEQYYARQLSLNSGVVHSTAIVVSGQTVSKNTLELIRDKNPGVVLILYMWDSLKNRPAAKDMFDHYDRALTFDHQDALDHNLIFRPTFYAPGLESDPAQHNDLDFSFVGTVHTDRYDVLKRIVRAAPKTARSLSYLYLQARWVLAVQKLINPSFQGASHDEFQFKPLSRSGLFDIIKRSNVLIDIEHPRQKGLTMRPLDAIGAGKKLITTNADIRKYDIHDPENILIIDRHDPQIPADFFASPARPVDETLRRKYSIVGWTDDILGRPEDATPDRMGAV